MDRSGTKTGAVEKSKKKPTTTFSEIFKQTPEKIRERKEARYQSIKKASFADIIKSPSTTTEVSKAPEENMKRTSESRGMRRVDETSSLIKSQPPRGMRRIDDETMKISKDLVERREKEAQRLWEEEQERRLLEEERRWQDDEDED